MTFRMLVAVTPRVESKAPVVEEYVISAKCNTDDNETQAYQPPSLSQQSLSGNSECNQQSETSSLQFTAESSGGGQDTCIEGVDEADTAQSQL